MNSQQIYDRSKKIAILFLMLEVFKTNRYLDTNVVNTIHLLKFNQTIMNTIIPFFSYLNLKAPQQGRPKPDGFWVDVFPYLTDNEGYNSFGKHFRITYATFDAKCNCIEIFLLDFLDVLGGIMKITENRKRECSSI